MKDRENNQPQQVCLPPPWCSSICRNAMNEMCVEDCALKRDCSYFEPKPNLKLIDMPKFPVTKDMTKEEKFTSVTIYLSKVVDHLQGVDDEPFPYRRPYHDRTASSKVSANIEIKGILHGFSESVTSLPATENVRIRMSDLKKWLDQMIERS
jgi:hypothetical protein